VRLQRAAVQHEHEAARIVVAQDIAERGLEEGLEVATERRLDEAGVDER